MTCADHEILGALLRDRPQRCPSCRHDLCVSSAQECVRCGERIELVVDSTRQIRLADPRAWALNLSLAVTLWWFFKNIIPAAIMLGLLVDRNGPFFYKYMAIPTVRLIVTLAVTVLAPPAAFTLLVRFRVWLLRARPWVRIAVLLAVIAAHVAGIWLATGPLTRG